MCAIYPAGSKGRVLISLLSHDMDEPVKSVICDARPMRRQTYDYLSSRRELLSFGRYQTTLFDDRA